jgi:hypothetical protein
MSEWDEWTREDIKKALKRSKRFGKLHAKLLSNIKKKLPKLEALLKETSGEDSIYRYYHQSFKVYRIQEYTGKIVDMLKSLAPDDYEFNRDFMRIVKEGTGRTFEMVHNREWDKNTRPMVEAFFHARYFLEMAVKYGKELKKAPECLPSGWASVLYFYNLR